MPCVGSVKGDGEERERRKKKTERKTGRAFTHCIIREGLVEQHLSQRCWGWRVVRQRCCQQNGEQHHELANLYRESYGCETGVDSHAAIVKLLLAHDAINVNKARTDTGATPLLIACGKGHAEII